MVIEVTYSVKFTHLKTVLCINNAHYSTCLHKCTRPNDKFSYNALQAQSSSDCILTCNMLTCAVITLPSKRSPLDLQCSAYTYTATMHHV